MPVRKLLAAPVSATTVVPMVPNAFLSWKRRSVESEKVATLPAAGDAGAAMLVLTIEPAAGVAVGMLERTVAPCVPVTSPTSAPLKLTAVVALVAFVALVALVAFTALVAFATVPVILLPAN